MTHDAVDKNYMLGASHKNRYRSLLDLRLMIALSVSIKYSVNVQRHHHRVLTLTKTDKRVRCQNNAIGQEQYPKHTILYI